ncbi:hypothetical protein C8D79_3261 [Bacteriovorax stolpii]|uniref:hypothetical protein n=1 Tax=Bacteriovorax stolpii TaxID=960 RepID=UPI0010E39054|nr:hypothetical protein [Bacteriovorax stolpii]TDP51814.1 hypothetical protein C8D79_3261 [Bacteriovorax stolpii]BDT28074.1 hypothetical protein BHI3_15400 [Bacteriovorax sp. HI3]
MKPKLHPVYIIIGLFLFKVGIIDNFRFHGNNSNAERRVASIEESRKASRN